MCVCVQEPKTILLGTDKVWKGSGQKRTYCEVQDEMMYISILETIEALLRDGECVKQVCDLKRITLRTEVLFPFVD